MNKRISFPKENVVAAYDKHRGLGIQSVGSHRVLYWAYRQGAIWPEMGRRAFQKSKGESEQCGWGNRK